jgi:DNA repair protein RecO (recombination protein O)
VQWIDDAIVIGTRRHGESSLIVEMMTRAHGRHLGLVRGGRSRRMSGVLQPGNSVTATWRARLEDHLGHYAVEPIRDRAARLIETATGLAAIQTLAALLRLLPERDPHARLFEALGVILDAVDDPRATAAMIARFELALLEDLGFGLDLDRCAVTGANDDLAYVSPRSGRAVTRSAGEAYRPRLLPLPQFLAGGIGSDTAPDLADIVAAFRLTGYFLLRHVLEPRGIGLPDARAGLLAALERQQVS